MPSFLPMVLSLVLVLGLLAAAAWVVRRAGLAPRAGGGALRIVSQLALGPRERLVLVEAGDRWFLLGVGSGGVRRVGTLDPAYARPGGGASAGGPASEQTPGGAETGFAGLLARLRGGEGPARRSPAARQGEGGQ
jgi:flagellar protein FliO/FliZ